MYISHLIVAPLLLERYFTTRVSTTTLAMASVAPDILSSLYMMMMELLRMMFGQWMEIHDHGKPPGWIDMNSGKPLRIGERTHSLGVVMLLAGSLSLFTGLYYAIWEQMHMESPPATPPPTPVTTTEKSAHTIAPPEVTLSTIVARLMPSPDIYRAMLAIGLAVMSHIFLDTIGENPKALLHPFSLFSLASSATNPEPSLTWTLVIDTSLALLTAYIYSIDPDTSPQSRLPLAQLTMLLMLVEGNLYLSSLAITSTVPTMSPGIVGAWWSLIRHVCGAMLVGGVLQTIPLYLEALQGERFGDMLRREMEAQINGVGELSSVPLTPCGDRTHEVRELEQSTMEMTSRGQEIKQNKETEEDKGKEKEKGKGKDKEKEHHGGEERASGFWDRDGQGADTQRYTEKERVGAGEGLRGTGTLPGGRSLSPTNIPHQDKRRRRSSHESYAKGVQRKTHAEAGDESPVFVDELGEAAGASYSHGHGLPGAGGGRTSADGSGTRKAYIH